VESLLFGDVGGVDASGDVVCAEPVPPFGVGDIVDEGHGDGGAAVASFNAGDLVVGVGARLASLAVAGFFGSAEFPGDFEVGGGDGGAVVPDGFGADLELVGEGVFVDELGFLGKEVQVGGEGGAVRLPVAGVRQDAVEHLEGVDASPFWTEGGPGSGEGVDDPGDASAFSAFSAVARVGVVCTVREGIRVFAAFVGCAGGECKKRRDEQRGAYGWSTFFHVWPLPWAVRVRSNEPRKT